MPFRLSIPSSLLEKAVPFPHRVTHLLPVCYRQTPPRPPTDAVAAAASALGENGAPDRPLLHMVQRRPS